MGNHQWHKSIGVIVLLGALAMGQRFEPGWHQTNGPEGGSISTIELMPGRPDLVYAGGQGGALYQSTDGGKIWQAGKIMIPAEVSFLSILIDKNDPNVMYVVNGSIFKTANGGHSWVKINPEIMKDLWITKMKMCPVNPKILIATGKNNHVYKSINGGGAWQDISGTLPVNVDYIYDLEIADENSYWISHKNSGKGGLYNTVNGGAVWKRMELGQKVNSDVSRIVIDPVNKNKVYVSMNDYAGQKFDYGNDRYLLRTDNGGQSWTALRLPYTGEVVEVLAKGYVKGTLYVYSGYYFKSTDDGRSWQNMENFIPGVHILDDVTFDPRSDDKVYMPSYSGIIITDDGGIHWQFANQGIANTSLCHLAVSPAPGSGVVYATSRDNNGTFMTSDWGWSWSKRSEGIVNLSTDEIAVNPFNPNEIWQVDENGDIYISDNSGLNWRYLNTVQDRESRFASIYALTSPRTDPYTLYAGKNGYGLFRSLQTEGNTWDFLLESQVDYTYALTVDPEDDRLVYSGYNPKSFENWAMVRKSADRGNTWKTTLTLEGSRGVTSIATDLTAPQNVYAGSIGAEGSVWASHDKGESWARLNAYFHFTNIHVMTADPIDPDCAYAGVWGGGTMVTRDRGQSWERLEKDPTLSASAIMIDPGNSQHIALADRISPRIYRTASGGGQWEVCFNPGPAYYRVLTAVLAPSAPEVIYASVFKQGGPMSGDLFRIENNSATVITGSLPRLPVALAVDPVDARVVYAALHGQGLYKTSDSGGQWVELSTPASGLPVSPAVGFNAVVVDPKDTQRVYLLGGCDVDVYLQHSGAAEAGMNTLYRSEDGGLTWQNLNDGNLGSRSGSIKGMAIAASGRLFVGAARGVFSSGDDGQSWQDISAGLNYRHTAGVVLSADGSGLYAPTLGGGVIAGQLSAASGLAGWEAASHLKSAIYNIQVTVDPFDSQVIYASGYPGGIFKSTDQGQSWSECNFGLPSFAIDDPLRQGYYTLALDSYADSGVIYLGLYGVGVYRSADGAATWTPVNGTGGISMRGRKITSLVFEDPWYGGTSETLYVATEEGVYMTTDGGKSWNPLNNGLGCQDIKTLHMTADGTLYAGSRGYDVYSYIRSSGQWRQKTKTAGFCKYWSIWDRSVYPYSSLLFHPQNPDIVYMGNFPTGVFKSYDHGASWKEKTVGWGNDGVFVLVNHPEESETVYAGTYNGVSVSYDGVEHWQLLNQGWPEQQWVFSMAFCPADPLTLYACSKNGKNKGKGETGFKGTVMKTTDGGQHWRPVTQGLNTNQEFYQLIADKYNPDVVYLATQNEGVFISRDRGESWQGWNDNLPNRVAGTNGNNVTKTMEMSADGLHLYFATSGAGVYRRSLFAGCIMNTAQLKGIAQSWTQTGTFGNDLNGDRNLDGVDYGMLENFIRDYQPGDLMLDGIVNLEEQAVLSGGWLQKGLKPSSFRRAADINRDLILDVFDLSWVVSRWLSNTDIAQSINDGLVAWWNMDEADNEAVVHDSSGNGLHGVINGIANEDPAWNSKGKYGGCLDFQTNKSNVYCGMNETLTPTGQFTIALWIKWNGKTDTSQGLVAKYNKNGMDVLEWTLRVENPQTNNYLYLGSSRSGCYPGNMVLPFRIWSHVAVTFDGTYARGYLNGNLRGSSLFALGQPIISPITIGSTSYSDYIKAFNGSLDEVHIYNRALSETELAALMNNNPPAQGLEGRWPFDEGRGTMAYDTSGHNRHGELDYLRPVWKPGAGIAGGALLFDNDKGYADFGNNPLFNCSEQITISAWIKVDQFAGSENSLIFKSGNSWKLGHNQDYSSIIARFMGISNPGALDGTIPVDDGQWHHIAALFEGTRSYLYIDGVENVWSYTYGVINTDDQPVYIGNVPGGGKGWDGLIDEVRIYNRGLKVEEIKYLYEHPSGGL